MVPGGGRIELICGPMFAGKSTELLKRLAEARDHGLRVIAIQPAGDTRSGRGRLKTHGSATWQARPIRASNELGKAAEGAEVVGIDEVHFFAADLADAVQRLAEAGLRVIAAGVDFDHRCRLFPAVEALQERADEVTRLTARCARCGGTAIYTRRLIDSDAAIVVGGAEAYEPRCAACFDVGATD